MGGTPTPSNCCALSPITRSVPAPARATDTSCPISRDPLAAMCSGTEARVASPIPLVTMYNILIAFLLSGFLCDAHYKPALEPWRWREESVSIVRCNTEPGEQEVTKIGVKAGHIFSLLPALVLAVRTRKGRGIRISSSSVLWNLDLKDERTLKYRLIGV